MKASTITTGKGVYNTICAMVGVGMLGLPHAIAEGGWIPGITAIVLGSAVACYCGIVLGHCLNYGKHFSLKTNKQTTGKTDLGILQTYTELGQLAAGRPGCIIAMVGAYGTCLGSCILFIITAAQQIQIITGTKMDSYLLSLIFVTVTLPFALIKTLDHVAAVALFGAFAALSVLIVVISEDLLVSDGDIGHKRGVDTHTQLYAPLTRCAKTFVTVVFSYAASPVFPEVNRVMKAPLLFTKVMHIVFVMAMIAYLLIACFSYDVYGIHLLSGSTIFVILPQNIGTKFISACLLIHVASCFVIFLNPVFREAEDKISRMMVKRGKVLSTTKEWTIRIIIRITITSLCYLVAISCPDFPEVMALVGGTFAGLSSFICPLWFSLVLFWPRKPTVLPIPKGEANFLFPSIHSTENLNSDSLGFQDQDNNSYDNSIQSTYSASSQASIATNSSVASNNGIMNDLGSNTNANEVGGADTDEERRPLLPSLTTEIQAEILYDQVFQVAQKKLVLTPWTITLHIGLLFLTTGICIIGSVQAIIDMSNKRC